VLGGPVWQTISFGVPTYPVAFSEGGLPAGTSWTVELGGRSATSSGPRLVLPSPNGTFGFRVAALPGWLPTPAVGNVTVAGAPIPVPIVFRQPEFTVLIFETGLPVQATWMAVVGNATIESSGPSASFLEPNGTYAVHASSAGYAATLGADHVTVSGRPIQENVTFRPPEGRPAPSLAPWEVAAAIGGAAAVLAGAAIWRRRRPGRPPPASARP
jgi:hypothetical protein